MGSILPMRFTTLVSAEQLAQHVNDTQWVIFDCRFTLTNSEAGRHAYELSHIPGARYVHLNHDLSSSVTAESGRHPLPDPAILAEKLGNWGVDNNKQVVVYDDSFGAMAARMWWTLRWLGHEHVALLDGGLPVWLRKKYETTAQLPTIVPAEFQARPNRSMWVDSAQVSSALQAGHKLVDARSEERFQGLMEPLDKVAGHIPGAINLPFDDNLDLDGTLLPADELRALYAPLIGATAPDKVMHMCGSGVTACHHLLAREIAGMPGGKLFAGSWSEWITDPARPVTQGE